MAKLVRWTENEDNFLLKNYKSTAFDKILEHLKDRSENSIRWRVKFLGITQKKNGPWSDEELEILNKDLTSSEISKMIDRSVSAINKKRIIEKSKKVDKINKEQLKSMFDLSAIEKGIPNINKFSNSSQYFALLASMNVGESFEFPSDEYTLVRNQIKLFEEKDFETKKWSETSRRVWRTK